MSFSTFSTASLDFTMSWESIGSTSTGDMPHEEAWILMSLDLAMKYIEFVCGSPPEGSELDVMWHDHDLGRYPSLGVWSDYDTPWGYVNACERALKVFDAAVSWHEMKEHFHEQAFSEDNDEEGKYTNDET